MYLVKIKLGNVVYPLFVCGLLPKGDGEGFLAWREKAMLFDTSLTELKSVFSCTSCRMERYIRSIVYLVKIKLGNVVYPLFLRGLLPKGDGEGLVAWREKARLFDTSLTELKSVFRHS